MDEVADILCGQTAFDEKILSDAANPLSKHKAMIVQLLKSNGFVANKEMAMELVRAYINDVCERILNCTAVFKNDEKGQAQFDKFMRSLGFVEYSFKEVGEGDAKDKSDAPQVEQPTAGEAPASEVVEEVKTEDCVNAEAQPVKRKRGRPRKNPLPE